MGNCIRFAKVVAYNWAMIVLNSSKLHDKKKQQQQVYRKGICARNKKSTSKTNASESVDATTTTFL